MVVHRPWHSQATAASSGVEPPPFPPMATPHGVGVGHEAMESSSDAQAACYRLCHHPHSDHPPRRLLLGPVPGINISNQALVDDAKRLGVYLDDMLSDQASIVERSEPRFKSMHWSRHGWNRPSTFIRPMRHTTMHRSRAHSFFDTPPRHLDVIAESPKSLSPRESERPPLTNRSRSFAEHPLSPMEHSPPPLRRSTSLHHLPRQDQSDTRVVSSSYDDLDSLFSVRRDRMFMHWPLGPTRRHTSAAHPLSPLAWDDSGWNGGPTPPILGRFDLTEEQREVLVERTGTSVGHRKMVGTSFEVGHKFYEQVLAMEPAFDSPRALSTPGPSQEHSASPKSRLPASPISMTTSPQLMSASMRQTRRKATRNVPHSHVAFSLPASEDSSQEESINWASARKKLSDEGPVSIHSARPSRAMLALEEEVKAERQKRYLQLRGDAPATPSIPAESHATALPGDALSHASDSDDYLDATSTHRFPLRVVTPTEPNGTPERQCRPPEERRASHDSSASRDSLTSLPAEPMKGPELEVATTAEAQEPLPQPPPILHEEEARSSSSSTSRFPHMFTSIPSLHHTDHASLLEVEQRADGQDVVVRRDSIPVGQGDALPRPAEEVLARPVQAPTPITAALQSNNDAVLKRDRMLVKVQLVGRVDVGSNFDELEARRYDIRSYRWDEYLVLLRPGRVELWNEARIRGRLLGDVERLKLRYVIPLQRKEVSLSLYSEVDRLLCLTVPRSEWLRGPFPLRRHGTTILLLNARASSLAADWMWLLWRELDGQPPSHINVHVPGISMRVRVPLPTLPSVHGTAREYDAILDLPKTLPYERSYERMTARSLMDHTQRMIQAVPQWDGLVKDMQSRGLEPVLAWRSGSTYNWVNYATTPQGAPRYWDALAGALLTSARLAPELQMVLNNHYPTEVMHPRGCALREPPAVEGFVGRLRSISGMATRTYLSTHDAGLYLMREANSFAPDPYMGLPISSVEGETRQERIRTYVSRFAAYEIHRELRQIRQSDGFLLLRDVCAIGSVGFPVVFSTELTRHHVHLGHEPLMACTMPQVQWVSDYDGTRQALDARLRMFDTAIMAESAHHSVKRTLRQFKLYLDNGRSIVFEAASVALAKEWMVHLFMLIVYWKCRETMDTRMLMHASQATDVSSPPSRQAEDHAALSLPFIWNWCRFGGCRTINLSGVLFWRTHTRQPFHRRYFILCDGQLLAFKLMSSTHSSTARYNEGILYRRKGAPILLRDAYVYKGDVADRVSDLQGDDMPNQRTGGHHTEELHEQLPRFFHGGLCSAESSDECTFVVRIRSGWDPGRLRRSKYENVQVPYLSGRESSEITFRARTRLERDVWVRMISHEIEKVVRSDPSRDSNLCRFGRIH